MKKKNVIPYMGLLICLCYFAATAGLIITGIPAFLVTFEISTALAAPIILLLITAIPSEQSLDKKVGRYLSVAFMSCCTVLTVVVHFVNLSVIQPLISSGVQVPTYLQIGQWPSVLMAVDYIAWGFFMGAAFLSASYCATSDSKKSKILKYTLLICGILCLVGFIGAMLINENLWYIAPIGYGIGTAVVCIELLILNKPSDIE